MSSRQAILLLAGLLFSAPAFAARPRVGDFVLEADEPNRQIFTDIARRYGTTSPLDPKRPPKGAQGYVGEKVTWQVHVPRTYRPGKAFGLLVWISPGPSGRLPRQWRDVIDEKRLIWIGTDRTGNPVWTLLRHCLAVEAVEQIQLREYDIDPNRVYVSGLSGGGRISSHVALMNADRFTGGMYIVGCNYYRSVKFEAGKGWPGFWRRPDRNLLARARKEGRFVLLTGETDFNRDQTRRIADAYEKDGFRYATYVEVPGMGHAYPPPDWFAKGIDVLDAPIPDILAARPRPKPKATPSPASRPGPATRPVLRATDRAQSQLQLARAYLANGLKDRARQALEAIVREYPKTPQAAEAKDLLAELNE